MKKCFSTVAAVLIILGICFGAGRLGRGHDSFDSYLVRTEDEPDTVDWDAEHYAGGNKDHATAQESQVSFIETIELLPCSSSGRTTNPRFGPETTLVPTTMP